MVLMLIYFHDTLGLTQYEVIVPAHSWISTSETVTQAGSQSFCDTDSEISPLTKLIEEKITSRTVGIIPVHLFGQPADMDPILAMAKNSIFGLLKIVPIHLAKYKGVHGNCMPQPFLLSREESWCNGRCWSNCYK